MTQFVDNSFMHKDPRDRNSYFPQTEINKYLKEYTGAIAYGLTAIQEHDIEMAKDLLRITLAKSGRIFVAGNGGSAAISDHLCCDFVKGTYSEKYNNLIVHSLVGSQALFTAVANDFGYEHTFSFQLKALQLNPKDALILISSSGNSPNILEALKFAHERRCTVIGLTGFDGGELNKMADVRLHIPVNNYGVVEDCHQALMHVLAQFHHVSFNV